MATKTILDLDADLVYRVLEYLREELEHLRSFGNAHRLFHLLVFSDPRFDALFPMRSRRYSQNAHALSHILTRYRRRRDRPAAPSLLPPSLMCLGILPASREEASLAYDHERLEIPSSVAAGGGSSGYFGFDVLPRRVVVWGDFSGMAVAPSIDSLLEEGKVRDLCASKGFLFGVDQQVMAVHFHSVSSPPSSSPNQHSNGALLFLGFASGRVHCVSVAVGGFDGLAHGPTSASGVEQNPAGNGFAAVALSEYPHVSSYSGHVGEITSLCGLSDRHLVSASVGSPDVVHVHQNALRTGDMDDVLRVGKSGNNIASTLSTASFAVGEDKACLAVGGIEGQEQGQGGDALNYERRRLIGTDLSTDPQPPAATEEEEKGDRQRRFRVRLFRERYPRGLHVVFLKFMLPNGNLVTGASRARVRVYAAAPAAAASLGRCRNGSPLLLPDALDRLYELPGACPGGRLESAERVGGILATAGGNDGSVRFWRWGDGTPLGRVRVHPGRSWTYDFSRGRGGGEDDLPLAVDAAPSTKKGRRRRRPRLRRYTSAVVEMRVCHDRSSVVCLCRDGHVHEWAFARELARAEEEEKEEANAARSNSRKRGWQLSTFGGAIEPMRRSSRLSDDRDGC